ncbi:MAG: oligosaccharide flippase family protein [Candidatus Hydrogenedentes bacterium]|nr:oligosaccharide flippase family protein [Candidatus Hydrogenedentota bacterium]
MSDLGRHGRNLSWMLIAEVIQKVLALALFAYATRQLSLIENGWYGAYLALFSLLVTTINGGFYDVAVRDIAQRRDRVHGLISSSLLMQTAISGLVTLAVWLGAWLLRYPVRFQVILVVGTISALLWAHIRMQYAVIAAHEKFKYISLLNILLRTAIVTASLALLYVGYGALALVAVLIPISVAQIVLSYGCVQKVCGGYRFLPSVRDMKYLLRQGFPIAIGGIAATGYYSLDIPLLTSLSNPETAGYYANAMRFLLLCLTLSDLLASVTYPILSRKAAGPEDAQCFALTRCLKASVMAALPLAMGGTVLCAGIVKTLCGERYLPSAPAVAVLMWVLACEMINNTLVVYLRAKSLQRLPAAVYVTGLAAKVVLSLFVIPRYGMDGFLQLNLVVSVAMTGTLLVLSLRVLPSLRVGQLASGVFLRPLAAAIIMGLSLWYVRHLSIILTIPIGAAVYGAALLALGGLDEFDRRMFKGTIGG